ncbi:MAG: serine hydrolase [Patescibacteria group bacterium]
MIFRDSLESRKRKKSIHVLLFFLISTGGLIFLLTGIGRGARPVISPIPEEPQPPFLLSLFSRHKDPEELRQKIQEAAGNSWKNYSILVEDYSSNFTLGINEAVIYTGASINKVPILAALYYLAQKGEVNLDQTITLQEKDIQDYGTGSIRYDPPGSTYSVKTLARLMMQKSDNTAAYLLGNYVIGIDKIQTIMQSWGLAQTDMVNNKISNRDVALLMRKIYEGKVAAPATTREMLAFLKDSDQEDRLPARLPKGVVVYHKTGNGVGLIHDVGIIEKGKLKYYLGIFTSDISKEDEAVNLMAKISRLIFDFMQ